KTKISYCFQVNFKVYTLCNYLKEVIGMAKFETLKNKVVVVAGGGKNLGALVSQNYADVGAKVVVHYHSASSKAEAEQTIAAINNKGGEAVLFKGDLNNAVKINEIYDVAVDNVDNVECYLKT